MSTTSLRFPTTRHALLGVLSLTGLATLGFGGLPRPAAPLAPTPAPQSVRTAVHALQPGASRAGATAAPSAARPIAAQAGYWVAHHYRRGCQDLCSDLVKGYYGGVGAIAAARAGAWVGGRFGGVVAGPWGVLGGTLIGAA